jgi:hypothetical protein
MWKWKSILDELASYSVHPTVCHKVSPYSVIGCLSGGISKTSILFTTCGSHFVAAGSWFGTRHKFTGRAFAQATSVVVEPTIEKAEQLMAAPQEIYRKVRL